MTHPHCLSDVSISWQTEGFSVADSGGIQYGYRVFLENQPKPGQNSPESAPKTSKILGVGLRSRRIPAVSAGAAATAARAAMLERSTERC